MTQIERIKDMPALKREIISYLFDYITHKKVGVWYKYTADFTYDKKEYTIECECMYDNQMFTYRNLHIEYKQIVIDIEDAFKRGLLH